LIKKTGKIDAVSRKILANHFLKRLHTFYKYNGKDNSYAKEVNSNIKEFADYLGEGKTKKYRGIRFKW